MLYDTDALGHIPRQHDGDFHSGSVSDNFYSLVTISDQTENQISTTEVDIVDFSLVYMYYMYLQFHGLLSIDTTVSSIRTV